MVAASCTPTGCHGTGTPTRGPMCRNPGVLSLPIRHILCLQKLRNLHHHRGDVVDVPEGGRGLRRTYTHNKAGLYHHTREGEGAGAGDDVDIGDGTPPHANRVGVEGTGRCAQASKCTAQERGSVKLTAAKRFGGCVVEWAFAGDAWRCSTSPSSRHPGPALEAWTM